MSVSYATLYLPGSSTGIQVVEGGQYHVILVSMGANAVQSGPGDPAPANPFPQYITEAELAAAIAALPQSGGGAVASVNGQTGTVVLDADDIAETTARKILMSAERDKLANITPGANIYTDEQARDAVGAAIVAGAGITKSVDDAANTITISATGAGGSAAIPGAVLLDDFAGADDDAKLTAALSAVAADTYPRAIQLTNRRYDFATANRAPFEGMKIIGPRGAGNPERGGDKMPSRVHLSMTGAWFAATAEVFTVSFHGLSLTGGSNATFLGGTANWYCLSLRDIFSSGLKSLLGTYAQKMLITAATFDGLWEINNCYETAIHLGGADNMLWENGGLLDAATAYDGAGQPHLWCDGLDKSTVGPLFITGEQSWLPVRVSGQAYGSTGNNQGRVVFRGMRIEGRNPGAPSYGALARVEGGGATFQNCWFNYGMSSPSNAAIGRTDSGIIHHSGGELDVSGCWYDRASAVPESVPFVWSNSAGDCMVARTKRAYRSEGWTQRPLVSKTGTGLLLTDASVRTA